MKMKAAQLIKYGGDGDVVINDIEKPSLAEGTVLVEVHAAGINPLDLAVRAGHLEKMISLPATMGGDISGVVVEVGKGVIGFKAGDEVYGTASLLHKGSGAFAEFALASAAAIAQKPKGLSHVDAGSLPLTAVSAVQAIIENIKLAKGQKILIHGGSGGIGSMAIQIAKHVGAYVATTARAETGGYVRERGANLVVDYQTQRFEDYVEDFDAVLDTQGGDTYKRSFTVLKEGGTLVSMLEQPNEELMKKYAVNSILQVTAITTERLMKLTELIEQGVIKKIHVDRKFRFEKVAEALAYLEKSHHKGKVVLKIK